MIGFDNQWRDPFGIGRVVRTFMGAARFVMWSKFTVFTSCGKFFCFLVLCFWGSSSSSLGVSSPLCSALSLPDCLKTQQSLWVWLAGFPGVLCI